MVHFFANMFVYVKLILIEHVYGWYLKIAKQLSYFFFSFSFSYNKSLYNFFMCFGMFFLGGYTGFLFPLLVICGVIYFFLITVVCSFFFALNIYSTFQQHISE